VLIERNEADGSQSVLLLRRAVEPGYGAWDLPAGYLDPNESAEEGAIREALEESGLMVELVSLAGVYSSPMQNAVAAVYRARAVDGSASVKLDHESSEHTWVSRDAVPEWLPRMAFPSMAQALSDWADGQVGSPRRRSA
jgi:ADP-ribose pyrophosphatase YjhB (NUDIX family)